MFVLLASNVSAVLSIALVIFLAGCALVAVVGTRIVRSKQKQEVRKWRLERKPAGKKEND